MKYKATDRVLGIFYRLLRGERISPKCIAEEYEVSTKTIKRDIDQLKCFLSNHYMIMPNAKIEYSKKEKCYILKSDEFMRNSELFALVKILLGSRSLEREEMIQMVNKLKRFTAGGDKKVLENIIAKEIESYKGVHSDCGNVIDNMWRLIQCIEAKHYIAIRYIKMNRDEVVRNIRPASVMFSEYYFYLIAYDEEDSDKAKFFRIDRIRYIQESRRSFRQDKEHTFDDGKLRERNQFMFPGEMIKITFEFSGLSYQSVLDRLPTAKVIDKKGDTYTITAVVNNSRGLIMYLLSQGSWIKVLSPPSLVDSMKEEVKKMKDIYGE